MTDALTIAPVPLKQLLRRKLPPAVPRVGPWLDSGESCLLWGGTGTGKSFLAMTLALGVAGGGTVLGWQFPNVTKVLYVDGEQSARDLKERFRLLGAALGTDHDKAKAEANLLIYSRTQTPLDATFFDLCAPGHAAAFVAYLKKEDVGFVVFDNLSTLSDQLADENEAVAFKPMQALFAALKQANVAAVLVHHAGKAPGARFRGSSNIATTFERIVAVRHNDKEPPTVLAGCATIEKYRGKPPPDFSTEVHFTFKTDTAQNGQATNARWEVNTEESFLDDAWRMFRHGGHASVAAFVKVLNEKHGTRYLARHFARDFVPKWELKDPARRREIALVKDAMGEARQGRRVSASF